LLLGKYYITISLVPLSGYISPEYAFDGVCSIKSDVFSFGVLVLEIISGKRTTGFYPYDGKLYNLISYVSRLTLHAHLLGKCS
jgi:serine/threonine protein kinase